MKTGLLNLTALMGGLAMMGGCNGSGPDDEPPRLPELVYMERDETTLRWSIRGYTEGVGSREIVPGPDSLPRPAYDFFAVRPTTGQLLYTSVDPGHEGYVLYSPVTGDVTHLPLPGSVQEWSPTGDLLTTFNGDAHQVVTLTGAVLTTVCTSPLICGAADWAPAGDAVVSWQRPAGEAADLWRTSVHGGAQVNLTGTVDIPEIGASHSPDGQYLAYLRNNDLVVSNADGSEPRLLLASVGLGNFPWSPEGSTLAVEAVVGGVPGLAVVPLEGEPRLVTGPGEALVPGSPMEWSPDGQRLVYAAFAAASDLPGVFVINLDGTGRRQLCKPGNMASHGTWMPSLPSPTPLQVSRTSAE